MGTNDPPQPPAQRAQGAPFANEVYVFPALWSAPAPGEGGEGEEVREGWEGGCSESPLFVHRMESDSDCGEVDAEWATGASDVPPTSPPSLAGQLVLSAHGRVLFSGDQHGALHAWRPAKHFLAPHPSIPDPRMLRVTELL